ncbi:DUF5719 family protein [Naasia lichenicola]|uniref:Large extracellular alpha-helical protein n=1 Tax=Naasia lichenicola TaxID=2565933 RepID=A0A4V3WT57_9MICO|nr:DUF5719 family protein [Naasia lichenicola]THG30727.1 hypothetical protein E6C64_08800 [Naasia lichenicola]THG31964.1 hypothetical protein E6C64_07945 [Naasia lichenicola]
MANRALVITGRVTSGVVALGAAFVLIAGASVLPLPTLDTSAEGVEITPVSVGQERVCPGPLLRLGDANGQGATTVNAFGAANMVSSSGAATLTPSPLQDVDVVSSQSGQTSALLSSTTATVASDLLSGAQAQTAFESDAFGLAAISCNEGGATSWIVAGATDTGRTSLLLLANPSPVPATVDIYLYGVEGPVEAGGLSQLIIAPHTQRVLPLSGYAPGDAQLAMRIDSTGGLISATLEQSIVRGLEPGGVDLVGPSATPSRTQIIPGVRVATSAARDQRAQVGGSQDVETTLRVMVPGADNATVTVGVTGDTADALGTSLEVTARSGTVTDILLPGLTDGTYTVTAKSNVPIVTAVRASVVSPPDDSSSESDDEEEEDEEETTVSQGGELVSGSGADVTIVDGERIDLAWFASASELEEDTTFAVAGGPAPRLSLVNSGDADTSVTLTAADGTAQEIAVPAGGAVSVDVGVTFYTLSNVASVRGAVSFQGDGALASYPVRQANPLATPLTVYH